MSQKFECCFPKQWYFRKFCLEKMMKVFVKIQSRCHEPLGSAYASLFVTEVYFFSSFLSSFSLPQKRNLVRDTKGSNFFLAWPSKMWPEKTIFCIMLFISAFCLSESCRTFFVFTLFFDYDFEKLKLRWQSWVWYLENNFYSTDSCFSMSACFFLEGPLIKAV